MKGRRDEDLKELRKKLGQMQAASNRHDRRALGARTGSNRSRPLRWRTRKGAN